jgi:hypothetical protein
MNFVKSHLPGHLIALVLTVSIVTAIFVLIFIIVIGLYFCKKTLSKYAN